MFFKKPIIATHSRGFHADDLFAVAILSELLGGNPKVVRTMDDAVMARADFVVDVGRQYDPSKKLFDHHQGGIPDRPNGIPYAAAGLVWKEYGVKLCGGNIEAAQSIDDKLFAQIDIIDNGFANPAPLYGDIYPYLLDTLARNFSNTWKEHGRNEDESFLFLLPFARAIVQREIKRALDKLEAEARVLEIYNKAEDKRVLIMDAQYPLDALEDKKEVLFVISPEYRNNGFALYALRKDKHLVGNRKDLPKEWGGKSNAELEAVTGVPGSIFAHLKLFLAVAKTKEGALALAEKALNA